MDVIPIILHDFSSFFTNCIPTKTPSEFFWFLSNISKDAEFQALSESRFNFLGHHDSTRLQAKYSFSIIDPPSLVEYRLLTKNHIYDQ